MKTIAISDIHGYYDEFCKLLHKVKYDPGKDKLYLLGDYVDGGIRSKEVVQLVMQLVSNPLVQVIGGNHDDMFLAWLDGRDYRLSPYTNEKNGGGHTVKSFCPFFDPGVNDEKARNFIKLHYDREIAFLRELPYWIEDEKHILVHAGVDPKQMNWKDTSNKDFRWIRNRFYSSPHPYSKTIVFGHTVSALLHGTEPHHFNVWFGERLIGIDGGIKFGGQLNALIYDGRRYRTKFVRS